MATLPVSWGAVEAEADGADDDVPSTSVSSVEEKAFLLFSSPLCFLLLRVQPFLLLLLLDALGSVSSDSEAGGGA